MNVVVFSGTTEGRELSRQLAALGIEVTVSVATPLGQEEQGSAPGVTVRCGRLLPDEMAALLGDAALCIDATHPYAVEATKNIKAAAEKAGVGYLRLLRPASPLPENCLVFESAKQAAEALAAEEGNLLLATGAKELAQFAAIPPERLYPRVLPTLESIAACEAANIPHRNIIAMQGPFSQAMNAALLRETTGLPVTLWDERRTTVDAHNILMVGGKNAKQRKKTVDAVAASLMLEGYLTFKKRQK